MNINFIIKDITDSIRYLDSNVRIYSVFLNVVLLEGGERK